MWGLGQLVLSTTKFRARLLKCHVLSHTFVLADALDSASARTFNPHQVATHAAVELRADKMLCLTCDDVRELRLPHYLPLDDAEQLITSSVCLFGDDDCVQVRARLVGRACFIVMFMSRWDS